MTHSNLVDFALTLFFALIFGQQQPLCILGVEPCVQCHIELTSPIHVVRQAHICLLLNGAATIAVILGALLIFDCAQLIVYHSIFIFTVIQNLCLKVLTHIQQRTVVSEFLLAGCYSFFLFMFAARYIFDELMPGHGIRFPIRVKLIYCLIKQLHFIVLGLKSLVL